MKKVLISTERQETRRRSRRRRSRRKKKIQNNIVFYFVITVDLQYRPLNSVGYSISLRYFRHCSSPRSVEGGELIRQVQTILLTAFIHVVPIKIYVVDVFFDMSTIYIYIHTHTHTGGR